MKHSPPKRHWDGIELKGSQLDDSNKAAEKQRDEHESELRTVSTTDSDTLPHDSNTIVCSQSSLLLQNTPCRITV